MQLAWVTTLEDSPDGRAMVEFCLFKAIATGAKKIGSN